MNPTGPKGIGGAALLYFAFLCLPFSANAQELTFPANAEMVLSTGAEEGQHPIATGPWTINDLPTRNATGVVQEFIWQVSGDEITSLSLLTTLRTQLEAQGYGVTFTCFADTCGGFDFRHALPVGQAPEMYVDLGDFHYLSATSDDGESHVALMISHGGSTGFVHLALIRPPSSADVPIVQSTRTPGLEITDAMAFSGDLAAQLTSQGSAPLDDLRFQTGASQLSGHRYGSLLALAGFLSEDPSRRVVLVGHTDASGSLAGNIALSEARANAVRRYLVSELNVDAAQVEAQGIGYLSPRAPNTTAEGREANRRVEVVLANPG